jgi:hypothetical protein
MLRLKTSLVATFATLVFTTPTLAQSICGERSRFLEQLTQHYGERLTAIGVVSNGALLELMTSETGSWTILITQPSGVSCMVATGESWEPLPKVALGPAA